MISSSPSSHPLPTRLDSRYSPNKNRNTTHGQTSLRNRLATARKAVQDATSSALKSSNSSSTLIGPSSLVSPSCYDDGKMEDGANKPGESGRTKNDDDDKAASDAAFELGMSLFGDDISSIEREMNERLGVVEEDLEGLIQDISSGALEDIDRNDTDTNIINNDAIGVDDGYDTYSSPSSSASPQNESGIPLNESNLSSEATSLATKIKFLRECSTVRSALDQVTTLSLSTSPSAVTTAKCLTEASAALHRAESKLYPDDDNDDKTAPDSTDGGGEVHERDREVASRILESLRVQIRRHRVDLLTATSSIIDSCISITPDSISVRAPTDPPAATSAHTRSKTRFQGLADAFDALSLLSSPPSPSAGETYGGSTLEDALRVIADNVHGLILRPQIDRCEGCFRRGGGTALPTWLFRETKGPGAAGAVGGGEGGVNRGSHAITLEWRKVDGENGGGGGGGEVSLPTVSPSKSPSLRDKGEVVVEGGEVVWCSRLFQFIDSIMAFVHDWVLLGRHDLCRTVGKILFGDYSASSSLSRMKISPDLQNVLGDGRDHDTIISALTRLVWERCIPSSLEDTSNRILRQISNDLGQCTLDFEQNMVQKGFLSAGGTLLSTYTQNATRTYTDKQRCLILAEGRQLLLQIDYHNTTEVGVDVYRKQKEIRPEYMEAVDKGMDVEDMSIFVLHQCAISNVALRLMELCRHTMDQAVDPRYLHEAYQDLSPMEQSSHPSSPTQTQPSPSSSSKQQPPPQQQRLADLLPPTLYRTARELLDLFRAIVPTAHKVQIASSPRTAALLHNDCVYFAHETLTLGLKYRDRFPTFSSFSTFPTTTTEDDDDNNNNDDDGKNQPSSPTSVLPQTCTFVDLVPSFRDLAKNTLTSTVHTQSTRLTDIIAPNITLLSEALRYSQPMAEWTDAETALTAGLAHLRNLGGAWKTILSHDVYGRCMGSLVDGLLSLYLDKVMMKGSGSGAKGDISEPACHFVAALFRDAINGCTELFLPSSSSSSSSSSSMDNTNNEEATRLFQKFSDLYDRFTAIGNFMDMSLADIGVALSRGTFRSVTGPELSKLIQAVFEDSEKRRNMMRLLES